MTTTDASAARKLFVNIPVADLDRSTEFFADLGLEFEDRFADETARCLVVADGAYFMLLVRERFGDLATRPLPDPADTTQAIYAITAGGAPANDPMDVGFMYGRSFYDPDGYLWEFFFMDEAAAAEAATPAGSAAA